MPEPIVIFKNVLERDMDFLFMEAFATDPGFLHLFTEKTESKGKKCRVISVERSIVDKDLGESDITVKYETDSIIRALLIEDKIDAPAMPDQHDRYVQRGQKGVDNGEYAAFDVFILCPNKYKQSNEEAAKYQEFFVSYEDCREYFMKADSVHSRLWARQIDQAIEKMKPDYKVDINEIAVDSFKKYLKYQKDNYPGLRSLNQAEKKSVNGWWPMFFGASNDIYIIHKTNMNCVDLTINKAADKITELGIILQWLHENGRTHITLEKTGQSAAFRIKTPEIVMSQPYDEWKPGSLKVCFDAIQELADLARVFAIINSVIFGKTIQR